MNNSMATTSILQRLVREREDLAMEIQHERFASEIRAHLVDALAQLDLCILYIRAANLRMAGYQISKTHNGE